MSVETRIDVLESLNLEHVRVWFRSRKSARIKEVRVYNGGDDGGDGGDAVLGLSLCQYKGNPKIGDTGVLDFRHIITGHRIRINAEVTDKKVEWDRRLHRTVHLTFLIKNDLSRRESTIWNGIVSWLIKGQF